MPYADMKQVNSAIKGIQPPVTLEQANKIASWADAIKNKAGAWPIAIAQFKRLYRIEGKGWVLREKRENEALAALSEALDKVAIAAGGAGSGNFAHDGRPGKRGGSQKGGGLKRIGATRDMNVAERRKRAATRKQRKAQGAGKAEGVKTKAFGNDPNRQYGFVNRVVSLNDLITSNTQSGAINPDYDQTLQPRARSRAASQRQIDNVAKNLVPESVLMDFHALDKGTPIVGEDNMVESGNGRALALMRAKEQYPESWAAYQKSLKRQLGEYGLNEEDIAGIENPVIVRVREDQTIDRAAFAKEANSAAVLQLSPLEQAKVDADLVSDASLNRFQISEGQSIDQALRSRGNQPFVREFVGKLPQNEAAVLQRADGTLNRMGIWRMKAAVFSKVFPGQAGDRLADTFLESLDSNIKNFENAIGDIMPKLAQAESLIASGRRKANLSFANDFSKAIDMLARLKESGMAVKDYLRQGSLFERELTPRQETLLGGMDKVSRKRKSIREMFERYADAVINAPDPRQAGMFGDAGIDEEQLLFLILQGLE